MAKDDYTAVNAGQLKNTARKAAQAIEAQHGVGSMGVELQAMITGWDAALSDSVTGDDLVAVNVGMLKNVAAPFYDRLRVLGNDPARFPYAYPWSVVRKSGGATTNGSDLLNIVSTSGLEAGMLVHGKGIPAGTTIAQFVNATQIRLSAPATQSGTGMVVAFARPGVGQRREDVSLAVDSDVLTTSATAGLAVGMMVLGPGLPATTRTRSIISTGQIQLSQPSTVTLSAASCYFYPMDDHAMVNLGQLKHAFSFGIGTFPPPSTATALLTRVGASSQNRFPQFPSDALTVRITRSGGPVQGAAVTYRIYSNPQRGFLAAATGAISDSGILTVPTDSDGVAFVYFVGTIAGGTASIECSSNVTGTNKQNFSVIVETPPAVQNNPGSNYVNSGGGSDGGKFSQARNNTLSEAQFGTANVADTFGLRIQSGYAKDKAYKKQSKRVMAGSSVVMAASDIEISNLANLIHSIITFEQPSGGQNPLSSGGGIALEQTYLVLRADSDREKNANTWVPGYPIQNGLTVESLGSITFILDGDGNRSIEGNASGDGISINSTDHTVKITPGKAGDEKAFSIHLLPVDVKVVNRDDPAKTWSSGPITSRVLPFTSPTISEVPDVKNGDLISWRIPGLAGGSFQWWAIGPDGSRKEAALVLPNGEWKLEEPIDWMPGKWNIHCQFTPSSGSAIEFNFEQNLGYRSPHVAVIGWINEAEIVLPDGSQPPNVRMWPQGTMPSPVSMGSIMGNFVTRNIFLAEVVEGSIYTVPLSPDASRQYVNSHLIKFSPNTVPTSDFTISWPGKANRKMVNLPALREFKADKKLFRAFHQFQVRFKLDESGEIQGEPVYLIPHSDSTAAGVTPTDLGDLPSELGPNDGDTLKFAFQNFRINPKNGRLLSAVLPREVAQINQGRISTLPGITIPGIGHLDAPVNVSGGHVSKQINNLVVPWIWSMIKFGSSHAKSGGMLTPPHEIFPSYHILYNGRRIDSLTHHISAEKIEEFIQLGEAP